MWLKKNKTTNKQKKNHPEPSVSASQRTLAFLNGVRLGNATSTRVTSHCSTEWGWIKSLQSRPRAHQGSGATVLTSFRRPSPIFLEEKKCPYQQDAKRAAVREVLRGFDWQTDQHFKQNLTGTQTKLFQEEHFYKKCLHTRSLGMYCLEIS